MMTAFQIKLPATALAALLLSTAVQADVTAQGVWDSWKVQMTPGETGEVTFGSETLNGGVLTVTDVYISAEDDVSSSEITVDEIVFTEMGDGTVGITMSEVVPVLVSSTDEMSGEVTDIAMEISQVDMTMLASGTPEATDYAISASRYGVEFTQLAIDGVDQALSMVVGLNDVSGGYAMTAGDPMGLTYAIEAASMDLLVAGTDDMGSTVNVSGKAEGLALNATGTVPVGAGMTPDAMFGAGLDVAGGYSIGPASFNVAVDDGMSPVNAVIGMADGLFSFAMNAENFSFDSGTTGLTVQLQTPDLPFPVNASLGAYGLGFSMPLAANGAPAPFAASLNLTDLVVNDEVWSMIDPGMILSRDPATAVLSLTGTATMFVNLMDQAAQEELAMTGAPPGQLDSLNIDELTLAFSGANVSATGAMTFDNTDLTTIPGMPKPTGTIDVAINGANALMTKLAEMGLIPQDQVMMAQMMLGMFAVPVGDDQLTSTIEFTEDGRILANGQQIQ